MKTAPEMTLLDWFAGQALAGLCARNGDSAITEEAYEIAEAMMRERKQWIEEEDKIKPQASVEWPDEFKPVETVLIELGILSDFNDPSYWKAIETWTDTCGFSIFYLDELRAYHAYQTSLPPGGKGKHKDARRGFRTWIANAINWRRRDAERKAVSNKRQF